MSERNLSLRLALWGACVAAQGPMIGFVDAATLRVPGEYPTIQAAIDAAQNDDTVLVADGVYTGDGNRDLDFGGKAIAVRAENGPANCTINCQGTYRDPHRGFYFHSGETSAASVSGFTIRGGVAAKQSPGGAYGGGILCAPGSPNISNCQIIDNSAENGGGVACLDGGNPTITDCNVSENLADSAGGGFYCAAGSPQVANTIITANDAYLGGGVYCAENSTATFTGCTIDHNFAINGGGMYCAMSAPTVADGSISGNGAESGVGFYGSGGNPTLINCTITDNPGGVLGGGVHLSGGGFPTISRCAILRNWAEAGGGIYCFNVQATISRCLIIGNGVGVGPGRSGGGGLYCHSSEVTVTSCIIGGNSADDTDGGGVFCESSTLTLANNTMTANATNRNGGGLYCSKSNPTITNSILWNDTPEEIYVSSGDPVVTFSAIQGGWPGEGNTPADPLFLDPASGDYHLAPASPCIDAGDPQFVADPGETDLDGYPRVLCQRVDMGTYEFGIGDHDCDRDVDLTDFAHWLACVTGPDNGPYPPGCEAFDSDADGDVDWSDFATFQVAFDDQNG